MFLILCGLSYAQTTLDQQLLVVRNDGVNGGQFNVAVQVKGTNLTAANTLGSATIDVVYDSTKLSYVSGTLWAFGPVDGYNRFTNRITSGSYGVPSFIRVGATGGGVGPMYGTVGYDITGTYATWVQLNFTIKDFTASTSLSIIPTSNAIGLFDSHANSNNTGRINNQTLSAPIVINNQPLPVELTSFTATATQDAKVNLQWKTATEVDNYGFDVERKISNSDTWEKISFVAGNGNSNSPKEYAFIDKSLKGGSKFDYRLKQIDNKGGFHYSTVNTVVVVPREYSLSQNYPNPFNPATKISYALPEAGKVRIQIFNALGQLVQTLVDENKEAGFYNVELNASSFSSGMYLYRIEAKNYSNVKKMMLLK